MFTHCRRDKLGRYSVLSISVEIEKKEWLEIGVELANSCCLLCYSREMCLIYVEYCRMVVFSPLLIANSLSSLRPKWLTKKKIMYNLTSDKDKVVDLVFNTAKILEHCGVNDTVMWYVRLRDILWNFFEWFTSLNQFEENKNCDNPLSPTYFFIFSCLLHGKGPR